MTADASITELRATRSPEATLLALGAILLATSLAAGLGALVSGGEADPWYAALNKAPGNPPGFLFGIVWPILYVLMAVGAFMAWRAGAKLGVFMLQLALNLAWIQKPEWFGLPHGPGLTPSDATLPGAVA